jgi:hypothetical protein
MTIEDRVVLDLADIRAIRLECSRCGTTVSFKAEGWDKIPAQCAGCGESWHNGESTPVFQAVNRLAVGLRGVIGSTPTMTFRVRLELDRPK